MGVAGRWRNEVGERLENEIGGLARELSEILYWRAGLLCFGPVETAVLLLINGASTSLKFVDPDLAQA